MKLLTAQAFTPKRAGIFILVTLFPAVSQAQETPLLNSATQPSKGTLLFKQQARVYYGSGSDANQLVLPFSAATGIARGHSLSLSGAGNFDREASGLSDITVAWKWRFQSHNFGPISTTRTALLAGLQIPSGSGGWGTGSFNPSLGLAHTSILGRLGLGIALEYKFNTGQGADRDITGMNSGQNALAIGASAMWRIAPAIYTASTRGAWYLGVEGETVQSADGVSGRLGPSLMYEAETWVFEAGYQLYPINTGEMKDVEGMFFAGFRLFF